TLQAQRVHKLGLAKFSVSTLNQLVCFA
ncbi:hypothetical protein VCHENC02_3358B, partial [Vibrio harveyi]